jgi:hypothetical protein
VIKLVKKYQPVGYLFLSAMRLVTPAKVLLLALGVALVHSNDQNVCEGGYCVDPTSPSAMKEMATEMKVEAKRLLKVNRLSFPPLRG